MCQCHQHRRGGWPAQQRAEQLDRCRVGPVKVVKDENESVRLREPLEQRAYRAVASIALVLKRRLLFARELRQRRKDMRKFSAHVVGEARELFRVETLDVLIKRIHEHRERQVALELRGRPEEDELPAQLGARRELPQQPRLADPGLPHQLDSARAASIELVEALLESIELVRTPDDALAKQGHAPPSGRA